MPTQYSIFQNNRGGGFISQEVVFDQMQGGRKNNPHMSLSKNGTSIKQNLLWWLDFEMRHGFFPQTLLGGLFFWAPCINSFLPNLGVKQKKSNNLDLRPLQFPVTEYETEYQNRATALWAALLCAIEFPRVGTARSNNAKSCKCLDLA